MSGWNGTGGFTFTYNWVNDKNNGIPITASRMDTQFNDCITGFQNCITRDGQGVASVSIPFAQGATFGSPASTFDNSGNLTVQNNVTVSGDVLAGHVIIAPAGAGELEVRGFGNTASYGTQGCTTDDGNGLHMICVSGGVLLSNGATSWSAISDERLKTDLVAFPSPLSAVSQMSAGTGRYKTDAADKSRSFLTAQSVQKVLPEAVSEGEDGFLSLRYSEVIPLLVAALGEAKARIEALETK